MARHCIASVFFPVPGPGRRALPPWLPPHLPSMRSLEEESWAGVGCACCVMLHRSARRSPVRTLTFVPTPTPPSRRGQASRSQPGAHNGVQLQLPHPRRRLGVLRWTWRRALRPPPLALLGCIPVLIDRRSTAVVVEPHGRYRPETIFQKSRTHFRPLLGGAPRPSQGGRRLRVYRGPGRALV